MKKPGNRFAKMGKKHLKTEERNFKKGPASLLKNSLWDGFQSIQPPGFSVKRKWTPIFQTIKKINGLLQTAPSSRAWCIVPFEN